jgi:hypothetical protein
VNLPQITLDAEGRIFYRGWQIEERPGVTPRYRATSSAGEVYADFLVEAAEDIDSLEANSAEASAKEVT